ncbi:MAG TPA: dienelactone hydrolase family protein [Gemmatimonadaceae bacterium]|jgi:carboxymethylenebutenolidase
MHETIEVRTTDGVCPTHVFTPANGENLPAIIMFMDAYGVRPAMYDLAEKLANAGYCVALPDLFYRSGWTAEDATGLFEIPEKREHFMSTILPTMSGQKIMSDMPAWISYLHSRDDVRDGGIGTTGYCLGGRLSITAAGSFPSDVSAAASYHGGGLATDAPDSPHKLAPQMKARVYVAGAIEDRGFDDAQKQRLEDALTAAHVEHTVETYNAHHGWVPADQKTHDEAATQKHWQTTFALFGETFGVKSPMA